MGVATCTAWLLACPQAKGAPQFLSFLGVNCGAAGRDFVNKGWDRTGNLSPKRFLVYEGTLLVKEICAQTKKRRDYFVHLACELGMELCEEVDRVALDLKERRISDFIGEHEPLDGSPFIPMTWEQAEEELASRNELADIRDEAWREISFLDAVEAFGLEKKLSRRERATAVFLLYSLDEDDEAYWFTEELIGSDPNKETRQIWAYGELCAESRVSFRAKQSAKAYERRSLSDFERQVTLLRERASNPNGAKKTLFIALTQALNSQAEPINAGRKLYYENCLWADILSAGSDACDDQTLEKRLTDIFESKDHAQALKQSRLDHSFVEFLDYGRYLIAEHLPKLTAEDQNRLPEPELPF